MRLARSAREAILGHARDASPAEACGLLGGLAGEDPTVLTAIPTPNVASDPDRRFEIDPEALLTGRDAIRAAEQELLGFYHSHPQGPAEPSATDESLARWADTYMLIASLSGAEPSLGAWFYTGETFRPETVEMVAGNADST